MTEKLKATEAEAEPEVKTEPATEAEAEPEVKTEVAPEPAFRGPYDHDWRGPYDATNVPEPDPAPQIVAGKTEASAPDEPEHRGPYDHNWRGPYEEMAEAPPPPDTGFGASLVIGTPTEGATVPPVHDVVGTGARPDTEVSLAYGEGIVVATMTAAGDGEWGFTGDTPAAPGPQTWTVGNEGRIASVSVIVEEVVENVPSSRVAEGSSKKGK